MEFLKSTSVRCTQFRNVVECIYFKFDGNKKETFVNVEAAFTAQFVSSISTELITIMCVVPLGMLLRVFMSEE